MRTRRPFMLALLLLLLGACSPDADTLSATADAAAVAVVQATRAARPTVTPLPTATAYPTAPLLPTGAPLLTQTPFPTATRYPTQTPYPTPEIITPTVTSTTSPAPTAPATSGGGGTTLSVPDQLVAAARLQRELAMNMREAASAERNVVACQAVLDSHTRFVAAIIMVDVSAQPTLVQEAHADYRLAIERITLQNAATNLVANCRNALAAGSTIPTGNPDVFSAITDFNVSVFHFSRALHKLGAE